MDPNQFKGALIEVLSTTGLIRVLLAQNGSVVVDDTSTTTGEFYSLIVSSEVVISECLVKDANGTQTNYVSTRNWGATLSAGTLLRVPMSSKIVSITLTSGTIVLY